MPSQPLGVPSTQDNCSASLRNNAPPQFGAGATTVTWTVTDGSGSSATCAQTVTVTDGEAPTVTTNDVDIFQDEKSFKPIEKALSACNKEPALPFSIESCVALASDQCVGPIDVNDRGSIKRIEFWAQSEAKDVGDSKKAAEHLKQARKRFDEHGCQRFAFSGSEAALPFRELDDPNRRFGFYSVVFDVNDGAGNSVEATCKVRMLGTEKELAKLEADKPEKQPVPLACAVCIGAGCGNCPGPVAVCKSAQKCVDLEARCKQQGKECKEYVEQCTETCKSASHCIARQLTCVATGKSCTPDKRCP